IAAVRVTDGAAASCRKRSAAQRASASQDVGSHDDPAVYRSVAARPRAKASVAIHRTPERNEMAGFVKGGAAPSICVSDRIDRRDRTAVQRCKPEN
ncbi:hypothetical protein, partial [Burkholderia vietnamiensis]|uniref:hypothetical protein n=1 Tax=Burkholderia vietnamiensis TaxID=60552 RepID=UPI003FEE4567